VFQITLIKGSIIRKELLRVENLKTHFLTDAGVVKAVNGVSLCLYENETLGIVGESGSGKSVTALSIMQLIQNPPGKIIEGNIYFDKINLLDAYRRKDYGSLRKRRGNKMAMIFQDPMTSLNPLFTVGDQVAEPLVVHKNLTKKQALDRAIEFLDLVGIPLARKRQKDYPHQFSGGMRQRVMIAMALICAPSLLIADEPTTALDVTIQAQILDLMFKMKLKQQNSAILLITHDMAVVAETCQRVIVMYCGQVQETANIKTLFNNPVHPYTQGLLVSLPRLGHKVRRLHVIEGSVPSLLALPKGCSFFARCKQKIDKCEIVQPKIIEIETGHFVRCHLAKPINESNQKSRGINH